MPLAWFIAVTDGQALRTLHPRALGAAAETVEAIVRAHVLEGAPPAPAVPPRPPAAILSAHELAREQGFTGDLCAHCGSDRMLRVGTCLTCQACGSTTGCG